MAVSCGGGGPDTTPPTVASVEPVDYTHVDVTFSEEVDPTAAERLANYALTPTRFSGQSISAVSLASAAVVRLTFSEPLFPIAYTVTVSGVNDTAGNGMAGEETAQFTGNGKVAFITAATETGDLSSWDDAGGQSGLPAADAVCQAEAEAAGFVGTFKAWLSDTFTDAKERIGMTSGPWIRTDGFPFTTSMTALLTEHEVLVPLRYDGGAAGSVFRMNRSSGRGREQTEKSLATAATTGSLRTPPGRDSGATPSPRPPSGPASVSPRSRVTIFSASTACRPASALRSPNTDRKGRWSS
jgi:hypothetical protein